MLTDYRECNKCLMFALCRGVYGVNWFTGTVRPF